MEKVILPWLVTRNILFLSEATRMDSLAVVTKDGRGILHTVVTSPARKKKQREMEVRRGGRGERGGVGRWGDGEMGRWGDGKGWSTIE